MGEVEPTPAQLVTGGAKSYPWSSHLAAQRLTGNDNRPVSGLVLAPGPAIYEFYVVNIKLIATEFFQPHASEGDPISNILKIPRNPFGGTC